MRLSGSFCSLVCVVLLARLFLWLQTVVYPDYAPYFQAHGSPELQRSLVSVIPYEHSLLLLQRAMASQVIRSARG